MCVKITEKNYGSFGKCVFMTNGIITLGATLDFGPRIIYFARENETNVMFEDNERCFSEKAGELGLWYAYGGHRLWCAPEINPETYFPDNSPVCCCIAENSITLTAPETVFGKKFSIRVIMSEDKPFVKIMQKIINKSAADADFAPWSVTSLKIGGICTVPVCRKKTGYLANRVFSLWDYSDINDSRFKIDNCVVSVNGSKDCQSPFKVGLNADDGFAAYFIENQIFCKCFLPYKNADYPDFCCNAEIYTNKYFLECELIGEKKIIRPNDAAVLEESWCLLDRSACGEPISESAADDIKKQITIILGN